MRALLRRILKRPGRSEKPAAGEYRSASYLPLRPWQVRGRRFGTTWRGLDPAEVAAFLDRVATDLAGVYAELGRSRAETDRIKNALRQWQSRQAPSMRELVRR
jgi:DivIVA domain-containing protein